MEVYVDEYDVDPKRVGTLETAVIATLEDSLSVLVSDDPPNPNKEKVGSTV